MRVSNKLFEYFPSNFPFPAEYHAMAADSDYEIVIDGNPDGWYYRVDTVPYEYVDGSVTYTGESTPTDERIPAILPSTTFIGLNTLAC